MENCINMITRSEEENRAEGRGRVGVVRSKEEEYRQIADLTGFDNLRALIEAEALIRSRKGQKKKKKKKKKKKNKGFEFQVQELTAVDNAMDEGQESKDRAVETVALWKKESSAQAPEKDATQKPVVDVAMEKEQGNTMMEMTKAVPAANQVNSAGAINYSLLSSVGDGVISSMSLCGDVTEMMPAESFITKEMKQKSKMMPAESFITKEMKQKSRKEENVDSAREGQQVDTAKGTETESAEMIDNVVLRRLLRARRYFDPPNNSWYRCFNFGQEGHRTKQCTMQKRKICGSLEHIGKYCPQNQHCFLCKGKGHLPKDCLQNSQDNKSNLDICLRCGDSGHDLFACRNDYSPDDLKEIQCYVCKNFGHLCCGDFPDIGPRELTCYNCGQSGHLGSSCEATSGSKASTACLGCERKAILQEAAPSMGRVDG